jgi:hypothetical protein
MKRARRALGALLDGRATAGRAYKKIRSSSALPTTNGTVSVMPAALNNPTQFTQSATNDGRDLVGTASLAGLLRSCSASGGSAICVFGAPRAGRSSTLQFLGDVAHQQAPCGGLSVTASSFSKAWGLAESLLEVIA